MITMKKKALVAMAMAAAMVAMPVVAGAVTSPGSQSDGTIGLDSSSPSQNNTTTNARTIIWHQFCFLLFFKLLKVLLDTELGVS